ncbi:MAG: NCS2 family permease [Spirochaetaceae bacterium]|nr:MAG: NCS2 family permease [Spirochaetaceae bacterium]
MEKLFKLKEHNTTVKTEVLAGLTTFLTMAYILIVNPLILSDAGMDFGAVFTATALASAIATLVMAFVANLPFALAPGMGLNAFFAYTVVIGMGYSWQFALTAVFLEGIIFIVLTMLNIREAIVNSIPMNVKRGIAVGIGLFITLIGLNNAGIVVPYEATMVTLGDVTSGGALLALIGLIITGGLLAFKIKGALLLGIVITALIGFPMGITQPPSGSWAPPSLAPTFAQFDFSQVFSTDMLIVLFTFLFVDLFDTAGTLIGVSTKAGIIKPDGTIPKAKEALFADAVGTTVGGLLGTSTVTTYIESASGVAEGGRTGLTSVTTAVLFLLALFVSPLFLMIPGAATAPALVLVGLFMMGPVKDIDLEEYTEAIPAFLAIIMMPFTYSIAEGIIFGVLAYVLLKLISGRHKEIPISTYVVALIFILHFVVN